MTIKSVGVENECRSRTSSKGEGKREKGKGKGDVGAAVVELRIHSRLTRAAVRRVQREATAGGGKGDQPISDSDAQLIQEPGKTVAPLA